MGTDVHADGVLNTEQTLAARINELYRAMLMVEAAGCSPELTAAVDALGKRYKTLQDAYDYLKGLEDWAQRITK
jgi:hypothetical protein